MVVLSISQVLSTDSVRHEEKFKKFLLEWWRRSLKIKLRCWWGLLSKVCYQTVDRESYTNHDIPLEGKHERPRLRSRENIRMGQDEQTDQWWVSFLHKIRHMCWWFRWNVPELHRGQRRLLVRYLPVLQISCWIMSVLNNKSLQWLYWLCQSLYLTSLSIFV